MYEVSPDKDMFFTENTYYRNMGYWKDTPQNFDDACQAMALLLAEVAQLEADDRILDVGFGFADQDILWAKRYMPREILGINLSPSQVEFAQRRVKSEGLEPIIKLQVGSATEIPYAPASVDKIVGLECAFHFVTREKFFHEAYRVLVPGGRLALVEPLPMPAYAHINFLVRQFYQTAGIPTPRENIYTSAIYAEKLRNTGFKNVQITSIREHVFPPFLRFLAYHLKDPLFTQRFQQKTLKTWAGLLNEQSVWRKVLDATDYIIAVADKPEIEMEH